MKYYWVTSVELSSLRFTGEYSANHKWGLPGIHCPRCNATWSMSGNDYPCTDLSGLEEQHKFSARVEEDDAEFERLCSLVRPLAPKGVPLWPGTKFGPLTGTARGSFGQLVLQDGDELLVRREALEQLQAEGLRGLHGCRAELRFRQKNAPELWELQLEPRGRLHPDCLPPDLKPPCAKCGRLGLKRPEAPLLDAASLPEDRDLFRLGNFLTMLIATERFVDTVHRLGFEEVRFLELPVR